MSASPTAHVVSEHRLALGVDLIDAARQQELVYPARIDIEYGLPHTAVMPKKQYDFSQLRGKAPQAMNRHTSGRYSLVYQPAMAQTLDLRIYDYRRCYVPRRLRVPLMTLEAVLALEAAETLDYFSGRVRQPLMFPGAAYHVIGQATGLRGRVLRGDTPMRWAHVVAHVDGGVVVGRARGDDRGEFLLLLSSLAASASELSDEIEVTVTIFGLSAAPAPVPEDLPVKDAFWDLPLEILPAPGAPDTVSTGETPPPDYVEGAVRVINFKIGRLLTGRDEDDFLFSVP